jgi:MFS family permease
VALELPDSRRNSNNSPGQPTLQQSLPQLKMPRIFPKLTANALQASTYLLGVALFSIAFLVFLNSSISFVVTEVIGRKEGVGDAVGTLQFFDELLALVACPLWGLLSDRIGVRYVVVAGYFLVAISLVSLVQSTNVYPELLVGRLGFSVGAAACSTMVTAILPSMMAAKSGKDKDSEHSVANGQVARLREHSRGSNAHAPSPSVNSELTITPHRYASSSRDGSSPRTMTDVPEELAAEAGTSQLAGLVGLFTGAGALLALAVFLPLPAHFQKGGYGPAESVQVSFYIVAAVAICVAIFVFFGLRNLPGEEEKSLSALLRAPYDETTSIDQDGNTHITLSPAPSYFTLAKEAALLGFTDSSIGLGYLGGFVARASSVAISLFIPFFVNAYFIRSGLCTTNPDDLDDIKRNCQRAYKIAAALSGICELAALLCAPIFGWLGGRAVRGKSEWPLLVAAIVGIVGYVSFGLLKNPDAFHGDQGSWAFLSVILIGISQIGAIVCSLGLLSRAVSRDGSASAGMGSADAIGTLHQSDVGPTGGEETAALLPGATARSSNERIDRSRLKGSVAGMYSFAGGAGILLLAKLGGKLFDTWSPGAPFFMMAAFNGVLAIAITVIGGSTALLRRRRSQVGRRDS